MLRGVVRYPWLVAGLLACLVLVLASGVQADQIRTDSWFTTNTLAPNDDGSTGALALGFDVNFFGTTYTDASPALYVNNNGNVTFGGSLDAFTPFGLGGSGLPMIAPFFADVDTRFAGLPVTYGTGTIGSQAAFGVNWLDVDYWSSDPSHQGHDNFQLVMIDRSDVAVGDFDIEYNYGHMLWETGQASFGDANGLGGSSAAVGYRNGSGDPGTFFELPGTLIPGSFIDGGTSPLNGQRLLFQVRSGTPDDGGGSTPELSSGGLVLMGMLPMGLAWLRRRRA